MNGNAPPHLKNHTNLLLDVRKSTFMTVHSFTFLRGGSLDLGGSSWCLPRRQGFGQLECRHHWQHRYDRLLAQLPVERSESGGGEITIIFFPFSLRIMSFMQSKKGPYLGVKLYCFFFSPLHIDASFVLS